MVELIKDEVTPKMAEDGVIVTRLVEEKYSFGEYLRAIRQMEDKKKINEDTAVETGKRIDEFAKVKESVEEKNAALLEEAKKQREIDLMREIEATKEEEGE